jgi:hypothetical protein
VEGRVVEIAGRTIRRRDLERPRQIGRAPEQLLVEVIPPAADGLGGEEPGRDVVEEDKGLDVLDARHDHDGDRPARQHAPDAEPPFQIWNAQPVVGEQLVSR